MSAYIGNLHAATAREQAATSAEKDAASDSARERLTPLDFRLRRLLASIPSEVQREGLSLAALQAGLKGRCRGRCHPGELGAALRKLGYHRRRQWHGEDGFRALWFPP